MKRRNTLPAVPIRPDGQRFTGPEGATGPTGPAGPAGSDALATTDAGDLVTGTLLDARLSSNVPLKGSAAVIAGAWDFTLGLTERGRSAVLGALIPVAHDAGDFAASGSMTWTVEPADLLSFSYALVGEFMVLILDVRDTTVGGVASTSFSVQLPDGYQVAANTNQKGWGYDNGTPCDVLVQAVTSAPTIVSFWRADLAAWQLSTNNTQVRCVAIIPVTL